MDPALAREVAAMSDARAIDDAIGRGDSEIQQFYKNATILISGGTGFMGKQLLEKLFRSCDIKKVFMLMRPKKKWSFQERLDIILSDPVFDSVKKLRPGFEKKIYAIDADVAKPRLGVNDKDLAVIVNETEIIIHGAATVNFEEPLKVAVNINVKGTVEMLQIGKQCKKLKSYVHISTAYSYATRSRINHELAEKFYDAPLSPQLAIEMVNTIDEQRLNDLTPQLIKNWPNTYTFTKAIAEEAVRQVKSELPVCIVRPAIVIASYHEPSPGWLDTSCVFGPSGFILGVGLGLVHVVLGDPNIKIDLVPVDLVNNAIIVAGWAAAKRQENSTNIYTVTSMRNFVQWSLAVNTVREFKYKYLSPKGPYYVFFHNTQYKLIYFVLSWLWHFIPAYVLDFVLQIMGKNPMAVKLYTKAEKHTDVLSYFTTNEWLSSDKNLQDTFSSLSATDRLIYNCDITSVQWQDLLLSWTLGARKYIVKDGLQGTDEAIKKQFKLKILHYTVVCPLYFFILYKIAMLFFALVYFVISTLLSMIW